LVIGAAVSFVNLGNWLVVQDPLSSAQAIVILGGHVPIRAIEGAELFHQKWAPQIWLTRGKPSAEDRLLESLDLGFVPEYELSRRVLLKWGVPADAIRILEPDVVDTTDEMRAILSAFRPSPEARAIVVTSRIHTRRVRRTWHAVGGPAGALIVRYGRKDSFQPERWWATSRDILTTIREVGGIVNIWLGFPLAAERR
jgi:uncharacterized SAM-binding protein YcdF (DUF218 family)